jgi:hypothetical protein
MFCVSAELAKIRQSSERPAIRPELAFEAIGGIDDGCYWIPVSLVVHQISFP